MRTAVHPAKLSWRVWWSADPAPAAVAEAAIAEPSLSLSSEARKSDKERWRSLKSGGYGMTLTQAFERSERQDSKFLEKSAEGDSR
jgi:hypothetical protein